MKEIREFKAFTFSGKEIKFQLDEKDFIYCESFSFNRPIKRLILKPNIYFVCPDFRSYDMEGFYRSLDMEKDYVASFDIDEDLFYELVYKDILRYSTDMAFLYGFDPELAYDRIDNTRAFKHVKDESKILSLQKKGIFN